jgi:hypothetical protein
LAVGSLVLLCVSMGCDGEVATEPALVLDAGVDEGTPDASAPSDEDEYVEYVVPTSEDELTLRACAVEQPCEYETFSQQIESGHDATLNGVRCVFDALAEGRAGRYLHLTETVAGNAFYAAKHVMIVRDDRTVLYARTPYGGIGLETRFLPHDEAPDPGQRCTLKPQSFFEECRATIAEELDGGVGFVYAAQGSLAFECVFGDGDRERTSHLLWFESCETESPIACE